MFDGRFDRRKRRSSRATAPLAPLAVALALALTACGPSPAPTPSIGSIAAGSPEASAAIPTPTPLPEPTPGTTTSVAPPCAASELKASHGLVEGAAGSRLTTVALVSLVGCSVDAFPAFGLRDANGAPLIGGVAGGPGRIDLAVDATYESGVRVANWCGPEPAFPLVLELVVNGSPIPVTGSSFPEEGDLPPCNGSTGPILQANAWAVAP
jgi:hypothetical protein